MRNNKEQEENYNELTTKELLQEVHHLQRANVFLSHKTRMNLIGIIGLMVIGIILLGIITYLLYTSLPMHT